MDYERYNAVVCTAWVPQGVAKLIPEKLEITKEALAKVIAETKENIELLDEDEEKEIEEDNYEALEVEALQKDLKISTSKEEPKDVEMKDESVEYTNKRAKEKVKEKDKYDDLEKEYNFESYDKEKDGVDLLMKLGKLTVHADSKDDPNLKGKEDDSASESENQKILPTDNLITVGHIDGDAAILEVYVYNSEEASLYVHHDILLPSIPLCLEWLNFDPEDENLKPGNLVAVGSMSSVIEVWDLDIIDTLEPAYVLGRRANKKKKISHLGHTDPVLSLAWNKHLEHILASGSVDKSIILWDLQKCKEAQRLTKSSDKVQDLKWHPTENHYLLSGSCDKCVRFYDCLTEEDFKKWKLDGEVEAVIWDPVPGRWNNFYASTDTGSVYALDIRQEKPLHKIAAHSKACTGMAMNRDCPGCLVTVSEDTTVKIWDVINNTEPKLVEETHPNLGVIHTISASTDCPFVISLGGDNKINNFKVWDYRRSKKVRQEFHDRLMLPIEDEEENDDDVVIEEEEEEVDELQDYLPLRSSKGASSSARQATKWKPPKKSKKKKGGHLDRKKKK